MVSQARQEGAKHLQLTRSLVCRLRQGDEQAACLLDALYRARLLRFCQVYLRDREQSEDVVQEVFSAVLTSGTVPECFRAWIYRIARNRCLDILRSRARRPELHELRDDLDLLEKVTGNLTRLIRGEQHRHLATALQSLSPHQQEVIRLRYGEGLSRAEIARVLDLSESVVKSRIFEGLELLRWHISLLGGQS